MKRMMTIVFLLLIVLTGFVLIGKAESSHQEDWKEYIEQICQERHLCPELVEAVIEQESNWNPAAVNGDCIGLMQVDQVQHWTRMQQLGVVDLTDPYDNILVGVDFLEELFYQYEDAAAVLMYYNAGFSDKYGISAYRRGEISDYAKEVLQRAEELERMHGK